MKRISTKPLLFGLISVAVMLPVSAVAADGATLYKPRLVRPVMDRMARLLLCLHTPRLRAKTPPMRYSK